VDYIIKNHSSHELKTHGISLSETYKDIFDQIQKTRSDNNQNWVNILKLAFEVAPDKAKAIMQKIVECDEQIKDLCKELIR